MNNLELLNADGLDESVSNCCGFDAVYSNVQALPPCNPAQIYFGLTQGCDPSGKKTKAKTSSNTYSGITNESLLGANGQVFSNLTAEEIAQQQLDAQNAGTVAGAATSSGKSEAVQAGIMTAAAIAQGIQNKRASEEGQQKIAIKNACGRKPVFAIGKKGKAKKSEYQACVNKFLQAKNASTPYVPPTYTAPPNFNRGKVAGDDDGKILGMPTGVAIGIGVLILAVGGFVVYKKFIAKK